MPVSRLDARLGPAPTEADGNAPVPPGPFFATPVEQRIAQLARLAIERRAEDAELLPLSSYLMRANVQAELVQSVEAEYVPRQGELELQEAPNVADILARASELFARNTIDIPRILVLPRGQQIARFDRFTLDVGHLRYAPVSAEMWARHLRTGQIDRIAVDDAGTDERRPEDYVVRGLIDFDDISYDDHADLLYELAGQVVSHLNSYLSADDMVKVLRYHQREIAQFVHAQMMEHFNEEASGGYEVRVSRGLTPLKHGAFTVVGERRVDYRVSPSARVDITKYVFEGFSRCLFDVQKFDSDSERRFAAILERDSSKWMKPAMGQFQIHYSSGVGQAEYLPDFVAETDTAILMVEVKAQRDIDDPAVIAKQSAAREWCKHATAFTSQHGGKPWWYVLIPHDQIADNVTLQGLTDRFGSVEA